MRLINTETGQYTAIKMNEFGWPEYQEAANRLAARVMPGHFADSIAHYNLENRPEITEFKAEIVRAVGDMTEHTGEYIYCEIKRSVGRPKKPKGIKKEGIFVKLPPALTAAMDNRKESRAEQIEKAWVAMYGDYLDV